MGYSGLFYRTNQFTGNEVARLPLKSVTFTFPLTFLLLCFSSTVISASPTSGLTLPLTLNNNLNNSTTLILPQHPLHAQQKRQSQTLKRSTDSLKLPSQVPTFDVPTATRLVVGFRLEGGEKSVIENGEIYTIMEDTKVTLRLFGTDFTGQPEAQFFVGFTDIPPTGDELLESGQEECHISHNRHFTALVLGPNTALADIQLAESTDDSSYYLCYSIVQPNETQTGSTLNKNSTFKADFWYAGRPGEPWFQVRSAAPMFPFWLQIVLLVLLLTMSGLFSGLNLGLMALDKNELQVIENCGTEDEKFWARSIAPVRARGNYLLCTLLLGNVLVNSTLTIFMDSLTSGVFAVIGSTLAIVIFGEIIPQAACSRHGLAVGAKTIYVTYLFMVLTFPLSFPISLLLDKILGEEIGNVYDRDRLMEYIRVTSTYNHLQADEMKIISGALRFRNIKVTDIMTPAEDVFMLPYSTILNFDTLTAINNSGYSRIPIYVGSDRDNVVAVLHVKDLALIDADHGLPLKVVLDFYSHPIFSVLEDVTLDLVLNEFKSGKSHMALVRRVVDRGAGSLDPVYEFLGVVTLEDIIEELLQAEINDETDVVSDNRRKQKRKEAQSQKNYLDFIRDGFKDNLHAHAGCAHVVISPQLALAASRFLASSVEPFAEHNISVEVLKVLLSQDELYYVAKGLGPKNTGNLTIDEMSPENVLYKRGTPADYFIMILEGYARVVVTDENQEYNAGPFCFFGVNALTEGEEETIQGNGSCGQHKIETFGIADTKPFTKDVQPSPFIADFSLYCPEKVVYLKVTRAFYRTARRTTDLEREKERERVAANNFTKPEVKSKQGDPTKTAFWDLHTALQPLILSPLGPKGEKKGLEKKDEQGNSSPDDDPKVDDTSKL